MNNNGASIVEKFIKIRDNALVIKKHFIQFICIKNKYLIMLKPLLIITTILFFIGGGMYFFMRAQTSINPQNTFKAVKNF
ncbi:MAG: hypothetical protein Ct9H300mP28_23610 [Pseudomonadota bacterium]|nr:MAG: hypothetical protein Ct9H300mP28_23610 [Pseudomonadota bacterium]